MEQVALTLNHVLPMPPRMSLRAHVEEIDLLIGTVEALDDIDMDAELREDFEEELRLSIAGTREKVDNTAAVLARFEAAAEASAAEIARLTVRKRYMERQKARLETYVLSVIGESGLKALEGYTSTLTLRVNPASVAIAEGTELEPCYLRQPKPPEPEPDKTAIKAALKSGFVVPGCEMRSTLRLVRS